MEKSTVSVSDFVALMNQTLEYAYPMVRIVGEVQSFKVNQNKYVFFELKDERASVGCFMMVYQLRVALEDGMKVEILASPKLTNWGKFSLTVREIVPVGEGSIKRSFELLVQKLQGEGLFDESRKRSLPQLPHHVGIISSKDAAGYADFVKIVDDRWGGLVGELAHVQVQGQGAADQIIRAIQFFNEKPELPEVLVLIRGGGSADDLAVFNDEKLVRALAASRIPTLVGVGHEVDTTLADLVADKRAATPSNAAQLLVPDRTQIIQKNQHGLERAEYAVRDAIKERELWLQEKKQRIESVLMENVQQVEARVALLSKTLYELNPERVLARGYALVRKDGRVVGGSSLKQGDLISIESQDVIINAGVHNVSKK